MRSVLSLSFMTAAAVAAEASAAVFTVPSFAGQPNSTFAEWQGFSSPAGPNVATTSGNSPGANWFDSTHATDGAFLIGTAPTGRIYSFSGTVNPQIDLTLPDIGTGLTTIVLQAQASGSPLDPNAFVATALNGTAVDSPLVTWTFGPSGSPMGGNAYQYTATWTNLPAATAYTLTYTPGTSSSSQTAARVDTISVVPEPTGLTALAVAGVVALRRRRI